MNMPTEGIEMISTQVYDLKMGFQCDFSATLNGYAHLVTLTKLKSENHCLDNIKSAHKYM